MPNKIGKHARTAVQVRGKHARTATKQQTSQPAPQHIHNVQQTPQLTHTAQSPQTKQPAKAEQTHNQPKDQGVRQVSTHAAVISICTIISRITGFARTWAMAFALGSTLLSSSYQVANNLPNQLYELVCGGMIVTAFLPVYVSVKKRLGAQASCQYASNLLTIVTILLGVVSVLCMMFPTTIIYTQSFFSDQSQMQTSVFFFQFFAIQVVFYGISAIVSGLLNANRDYLWSSIAPVFNNVIVIATFLAYAYVAPTNPGLALYIIAIGNPAGVLVQMAIQLPALKRNGIHLRLRINLRDGALLETLRIGVPAIIVMVCSFVVVSVQNAASYGFADNGPSILAYSRLWFTLPYSFLAVPITTAMFTELSDMQAEGNTKGVKLGIVGGINQIMFFMIPMAMYLIVFSVPLVTLYHAGAFTLEHVNAIASYLAAWAVALPFYGVNTYLQKTFSCLRKMGVFALINCIAATVQVAFTILAAMNPQLAPIESIAVAETAFYIVADTCLLLYLRVSFGTFGLRKITVSAFRSVCFGVAGACVGAVILFGLESCFGKISGSIPQAVVYIIVAGMLALLTTFLPAYKMHVPEAAFLHTWVNKLKRKAASASHETR